MQSTIQSSGHSAGAASKSFVLAAMQGDRGGQLTIFAILAAVVLIPLANTLLPAGHPLHVETFTISLMGKYLSYAMLALAVDLVWGYLGILSLGHGAFFCAWRLRHGNVSDAPNR